MAKRKHWHVNVFMPGCLNDHSEGPFRRKDTAFSAAAALARGYREDGFIVRGAYGRYEVAPRGGTYGLWIIKAEECDEPYEACEEAMV